MRCFRQRDITDCGAACLAAVASHYKLHLPIARVRQYAGTDQQGTTVFAMVEAATKLGFSAKGVKGPFEALPRIPLPAIAHVVVNNVLLHYVVIVRITRRRVVVMDPMLGRIERIRHEKFKRMWGGVLILLAPGEAFEPGNKGAGLYGRFWRLVRPHRSVLAQAFFGAVLSTVLALSMSIYVQKIVDSVVVEGNRQLLNLMGVAMLLILGFRVLLGVGQSLLSLRTGQKIDAALILSYYRHLLSLPQAFFDTMRVGEIVSRVNDAVKIRVFLNESALGIVINALVLVFALGAMFLYSTRLALLSAALLALYLLVYAIATRLNRKFQRGIMERSADFDSQLVDSLRGELTVRSFRLEWLEQFKTENAMVRLLRTAYRAGLARIGTAHTGNLVTQAYTIVLLWIGAALVIESRLTPGELMSCYALAGYLTGPAGALLQSNSTMQDALIASERLFEILDLETEQDPGTIKIDVTTAISVALENVAFHHAGRREILHNVSMRIPAGRISVLRGESGSGKSTILALIQGLYAPTSGRISVAGCDLKLVALDSLRRAIAVVPQRIDILTGSIAANIALGDFTPDMLKVVTICKNLCLYEWIESLPQGFLTPMNGNGLNLSGGQRQRIGIARALYLDAQVMLFDEPTAALDAESEKAFLDVITDLKIRRKTLLLISHSERVLHLADQILILSQGRVTEITDVSMMDRRREIDGTRVEAAV